MTDHPSPSLEDLYAQLDQLRLDVAALKIDLDDAFSRIGEAREYSEMLNERRVRDLDRLERADREHETEIARALGQIERVMDLVRRLGAVR